MGFASLNTSYKIPGALLALNGMPAAAGKHRPEEALHPAKPAPNAPQSRRRAGFFAFFAISADFGPQIGEKPHKKSNACCICSQDILKCRAAYLYT